MLGGRHERLFRAFAQVLPLPVHAGFERETFAKGLCAQARWALVALVALVLVPSFAFAAEPVLSYNDMAVVWGPNPVRPRLGSQTLGNGVVCTANADLNAALVTLGYDVLDSRLTHDVKAKLSNESTGGAFYTFSKLFERFKQSDGYHYPSWDFAIAGPNAFIDTIATLYGDSNVWWAIYSDAQAASAKEDLDVILNGGDLGGGSSGSEFNGVVPDTFVLYPISGRYTASDSDWKAYPVSNVTPVLSLGSYSSKVASLLSSFGAKYYLFVYLACAHSSMSNPYFSVQLVCSDKPITYEFNDGSSNYYNGTVTFRSDGWIRGNWNTYSVVPGGGGAFQIFTSSPTCNRDTWLNPTYFTYSSNGVLSYDRNSNNSFTLKGFWCSQPEEVVIPPTQWPDDPETPAPTAPTVPDPPETDTPAQPASPTPPTNPTPTNPTYPIQNTYIDNTYTADLQGILDAMAEHCQHLQDALYDNFSDFYSTLSADLDSEFNSLRTTISNVAYSINQHIEGQFGWLGELISDNFQALGDYMRDLAEWLAEQLQFDVSGDSYDDSSVVSWLKKIYSKLGLGINSKPSDPVADPAGTGSWLQTLFDNLITALTDLFPDLLQGLADDVDALKGKFPFSIPWDIAAVLGILVAPAQTPEFDVPAYAVVSGGGVEQVGTYHVDLHFLDDIMGAVHVMLKLTWVVYLAVHVKDLMTIIEAPVKGF